MNAKNFSPLNAQDIKYFDCMVSFLSLTILYGSKSSRKATHAYYIGRFLKPLRYVFITLKRCQNESPIPLSTK